MQIQQKIRIFLYILMSSFFFCSPFNANAFKSYGIILEQYKAFGWYKTQIIWVQTVGLLMLRGKERKRLS